MAGTVSLILLLTTFVEAMIGAHVHRKEHRLTGNILFACAFITALATGVSIWNDNREWSLTSDQQRLLAKYACEVRTKFPFIISHPPGIPEASLPARQIQAAFSRCGWKAPTFPMDFYLPPETQRGIYVAYGDKERVTPSVQTQVRELSFVLRKAGIDHDRNSHTLLDSLMLDDAPQKVGIVVGKRPTLWEHVFGYGQY